MQKRFPGGNWSHTLGKDLHDCQRRVFYRVYGTWGWWDARSAPETRELHLLKVSGFLPQKAGVLTHDAIRKVCQHVRSGHELGSTESLMDRIEERLRTMVGYSEARLWEELRNPADASAILAEHVLGMDLPQRDIDASVERCRTSIETFVDQWLPELLVLGKESWQSIDSTEAVPYKTMASYLGFTPTDDKNVSETVLFVAPDFLSVKPERARLIDWKTGVSTDPEQLITYAFWPLVNTLEKHGTRMDPTWVVGQSVPLCADREDVFEGQMTIEALWSRAVTIRADVERLAALRPAGIARQASAFPRTPHEGRCRGCVFQQFCLKDPE